MSVSFAPAKLRIPPGFEALLEGFCRQVLKEQPEQIIPFAAEYFAAKLEARNGSDRTQQTGLGKSSNPTDLETPAISSGQALLDEEASPPSVEKSPASEQELTGAADNVEMSSDIDKDRGVSEEECSGSINDEAPAIVTERGDIAEENGTSSEVPQPIATDVDKDEGTAAEEAVADANVEPSGEDPSGVNGTEEESGTVSDKPPAILDDAQPTVADGGVGEGASSSVNMGASEPVAAENESLQDEKDDAGLKDEETGDGVNIERNIDNVEESGEGEGGELQEPSKDGGSDEGDDHDIAAGEGDAEVETGEEPVKVIDDGGNGEENGDGGVEGKGTAEEEEENVPPETEES